MVKTSEDIMDINPLERMDKLNDISNEKKNTIAAKKKEFEELEKKKRKEIEDLDAKKKKELEEIDAKKKELEDLEKKKVKEIEETETLIEDSFQDLMRHKRMLIKEEEDLDTKKRGANLEESLGNPETQSIKNTDYTSFFEKLKPPEHLYDVTNNGFYNNLKQLRDKAMKGEITPQEEEFIHELREKFETFNDNNYIGERDQKQYVQRSLKVIEDIDVSMYYQ
jgi:hypothetical protein